MNNILIKTEKLCKTFRSSRLETPVLFDIELEIRQGEFVAIMGPSGCGKSTLMHVLGLMLAPSDGRVFFENTCATSLGETARARIRREKIGFVFQRFNLLPTVNAYQNIAIAERLPRRPLDGQITRTLEAVGMSDRASYKPSQLSIGQPQRIAIARAIVHQPAVVFADEATGNLDSANTQRILELFHQIHQQHNISIVMVTHSLSAAQEADRIIYMNDGRIQNV